LDPIWGQDSWPRFNLPPLNFEVEEVVPTKRLHRQTTISLPFTRLSIAGLQLASTWDLLVGHLETDARPTKEGKGRPEFALLRGPVGFPS